MGIKAKGVFAEVTDLRKGMKYPVIQRCLENYFVTGTSVLDTLRACRDIYDFCASQKSGAQFTLEFHTPDGKVQSLQKNNRFYVAKNGGALIKRHKETQKTTKLMAGEATRLLNDVDENASFESYDVSLRFYEREANKVINLIEPEIERVALF